MNKYTKKVYPPPLLKLTWKFLKIALKHQKIAVFPHNLPLVLQMLPLLLLWISRNMYKNTKPCELTCVKKKNFLVLFDKNLNPKNILKP